MGVKLLRHGRAPGGPGEPGSMVGVTGRMLHELAGPWPELLAADPRELGLYQALGREKLAVEERLYDQLTTGGFDSLRASAMIFDHTPYGPFAQLAIALGATGPCFTLEADELAGPMAFLQAAGDLEDGRCRHALIGTYTLSPLQGTMVFLEGTEGGLRHRVRHTYGPELPEAGWLLELGEELGRGPALLLPPHDPVNDPHGLLQLADAMERAASGTPRAVWRVTPDGRGMLLAFGGRP